MYPATHTVWANFLKLCRLILVGSYANLRKNWDAVKTLNVETAWVCAILNKFRKLAWLDNFCNPITRRRDFSNAVHCSQTPQGLFWRWVNGAEPGLKQAIFSLFCKDLVGKKNPYPPPDSSDFSVDLHWTLGGQKIARNGRKSADRRTRVMPAPYNPLPPSIIYSGPSRVCASS